MPSSTTRREVLGAVGLTALAAAAPSFAADAVTPEAQSDRQATPPAATGDPLVLGVLGPGGQGTHLLQSFSKMKDVRVA